MNQTSVKVSPSPSTTITISTPPEQYDPVEESPENPPSSPPKPSPPLPPDKGILSHLDGLVSGTLQKNDMSHREFKEKLSEKMGVPIDEQAQNAPRDSKAYLGDDIDGAYSTGPLCLMLKEFKINILDKSTQDSLKSYIRDSDGKKSINEILADFTDQSGMITKESIERKLCSPTKKQR